LNEEELSVADSDVLIQLSDETKSDEMVESFEQYFCRLYWTFIDVCR